MKKRRLSSLVNWIGQLVIDFFFLFLFVRFLIIYLQSNDKFVLIILIFLLSFWFLVFYMFNNTRVVYVDSENLYLVRFFLKEKIELSDVKSVYSKKFFPFGKSNTYIIEYLDNNLNIKKVEFYASITSLEDVSNFITKIDNLNQ